MTENYLYSYFRKVRKKIEKQIDVIRKKYDENAIHKLRVNIKKLRALFRFLEQNVAENQVDAKALLKEIKSLFKAAGAIRDVQVQQNLLSFYNDKMNKKHKEFALYLDRKGQSAKENFARTLNKFDMKSMDKKQDVLKDVLENIDKERIEKAKLNFVDERYNRIHGLLQEEKDDDKIHKIRIALKEANYILAILKKYKSVTPQAKTALKKLKKIGETLGNWHDRVVFLEYFERFAKEHPDIAASKKYVKLRKQIEADKAKLFENIESKLVKYMQCIS